MKATDLLTSAGASVKFLVVCVSFLSCSLLSIGQARFSTSGTSSTFLFDNNSSHRVGLYAGPNSTFPSSPFTPVANFEIRKESAVLSSIPLLLLDLNNGSDYGAVRFMFNDNYIDFAVQQTNSLQINHFAGGVYVGNFLSSEFSSVSQFKFAVKGRAALQDKLTFLFNQDFHGANIVWQSRDYDDTFTFTCENLTTQTSFEPLILDPLSGVTTHGLLKADRFMLIDGAGANYFLVSDQYGNGTWTDPAILHDDDWIPVERHGTPGIFDIYLNDKYVYAGLGTLEPQSKLHVVDGNIMISRSPAKAPGSLNGSVLFGDVVSTSSPLGNWGIEYYTNEDVKGLNFWKPWTTSNSGGNQYLFLTDDGRVCIGGYETIGKVQIDLSEEDNQQYALIINQKGTTKKGSEIRFDIGGQEKWAIGHYTWTEEHGDGFFIWDQHNTIAPVFISSKDGGSIGIYDDTPSARFDVNGTFRATTAGIGTTPPTPGNQGNWRLFVEGGIKAREIKVTILNFADHVFSEKYNLLTIDEYSAFIKNNKHLPGVPSEAEVQQNKGIELGVMQVKLLEKIEEQALYIINLQNQINELRQVIATKMEVQP